MNTTWLIDELKLLNSILSSPTFGTDNTDQQVGAYIGTHRAATILLTNIIETIEVMTDEEEAF